MDVLVLIYKKMAMCEVVTYFKGPTKRISECYIP